jgi:tetratricopeptide (TPR) repeat protein
MQPIHFFAIVLCLGFDLAFSFLPTTAVTEPHLILRCQFSTSTSRTSWRLPAKTNINNGDTDGDDEESNNTNDNGKHDREFPPLTSMERERRKEEMHLLAKLYRDDKAITEFQWFAERGPEVQALLTTANNNIGKGPDHWPEAQAILLDLIKRDASFLEPQVRLSKLYCLQGRFDEAATLSQQVLESKPWHFVALETMVAISTAQGNTVLTELWKSRRLPTPSQKEAREQWVDRALQDAEEILRRMEQQQRQE